MALFLFNDAYYIGEKFMRMVERQSFFAVFGSKNDMVKDLTITGHNFSFLVDPFQGSLNIWFAFYRPL